MRFVPAVPIVMFVGCGSDLDIQINKTNKANETDMSDKMYVSIFTFFGTH